jgi:hypothetical protein
MSSYNPQLDDGSIDMQDSSIIALMETGCRSSQRYNNVFRALHRESQKCQRCQNALRDQAAQIHGPDAITENVQTALSGCTRLVVGVDEQLVTDPLHEPPPEIAAEDFNDPVDDVAGYFQALPAKDHSAIYVGVSVMTEGEIKARTIPKRIRNGIPAIKLDTIAYRARILKDNMRFDDYLNGPSLESVQIPRPRGLQNMTPVLGMWQLFRDWGFRLRPSSLHQFYLAAPSPDVFLSHIFAVPSPEVLENRIKSRVVMEFDSFQAFSGGVDDIGKHGPVPRSILETPRTLTWGLNDMVDFHNTGPLNSDESCAAYVQGRWYDMEGEPKLITLDLERDAMKVPPDHVTISVDIDSVIWLTYRLSFKTSVNLHVLPYYGKKPPIHINNHVYINVLWPRSEEDIASGSRQEWFENRVPVSHIPHTHFACIGQGYGAVNIYIFFPRMMHRKELVPFWDVQIPKLVQCWWLRHVVYPALKIVMRGRNSIAPYVNFTLDEMLTKSGARPGKVLPLNHADLSHLQKEMHRIVNGPDVTGNFAQFGSYFFLLDIKGIKLLTTTDDLDAYDPFQNLKAEFPALDWTYMINRTNGELMLDVGVSFHPPFDPCELTDGQQATDPEAQGPWEPGGPWGTLTGIWRREKLEMSYDTAGFNKGKSHSTCTFSDYGGVQAEMPRARAEQVHINFRQSYNLAYEVIRGTKSRERALFDPRDAYMLSETFRSSTQDLTNGFFSSVKKSYGVRDEFRVSGSTVLTLLPMIKTRVSSSVHRRRHRFSYIFSGEGISRRARSHHLGGERGLVQVLGPTCQ